MFFFNFGANISNHKFYTPWIWSPFTQQHCTVPQSHRLILKCFLESAVRCYGRVHPPSGFSDLIKNFLMLTVWHLTWSSSWTVYFDRSLTTYVPTDKVRIQKPVVTYDVVSCYRKLVCLNLFAVLPNVFYQLNFIIIIKHCLHMSFLKWKYSIWEQKLLKSSFIKRYKNYILKLIFK
jgi:hypothetical protein